MNKLPDGQRLEPGCFYYDVQGELWCCYRTDLDQPEQRQAMCVRVDYDYADSFYIDGRCGPYAAQSRCLVEKVSWVAGASHKIEESPIVQQARSWLRTHARDVLNPVAIDELARILCIPVAKGWTR